MTGKCHSLCGHCLPKPYGEESFWRLRMQQPGALRWGPVSLVFGSLGWRGAVLRSSGRRPDLPCRVFWISFLLLARKFLAFSSFFPFFPTGCNRFTRGQARS